MCARSPRPLPGKTRRTARRKPAAGTGPRQPMSVSDDDAGGDGSEDYGGGNNEKSVVGMVIV